MEEEQPQSIADRIAALKLNQVGRVPASQAEPAAKRPRPPPPPRPQLPARPSVNERSNSTNLPPTNDYAAVSNGGISNLPESGPPSTSANGMNGGARPALPPRTSTQSLQSPPLPARRPSESPALPARRTSAAPSIDSRRPSDFTLSRKASNESVSSIATAASARSTGTSVTSGSGYAIRAPAYDPSTLPALPPKKTQEEKDATFKKYNSTSASTSRFPLKSMKSTPNVQPKQIGTAPPPPARPAAGVPSALPSRTNTAVSANTVEAQQVPAQPQPRQLVEPPVRRSALSFGLNKDTEKAPAVPARPGSVPQVDGGAAPPPIPASSKPDLAALQASKPKLNGTAPATGNAPAGSCLLCRDFSAADAHAARFPREALPSQDLGWLAQQLTAPFPSPTDKARTIFTWLHHNVAYDTVAFFNHNVKPSTPQSTLQSGLAVCEGYAGLFAALAMKVGLEAYVVGGHGKGYGYSKHQAGQPIPPYSAGHAWNVVKIDDGQWKLIDCCWGAGAVNGKNQPYQKRFAPERFTQSNDDFGLDHFPGDSSKQFRNDGRIVSWEEYITGNKNGCGADFFSGFIESEGLSSRTFQPAQNPIVPSQHPGPTIRFSFQKKCPHWDPVRCGKGPYYLYVMVLTALEGSGRNRIPFETNGDVWWCDIPVADLGGPGNEAKMFTITQFNGKDGRGLTAREFRETRNAGWAMGGVCKWQIARGGRSCEVGGLIL